MTLNGNQESLRQAYMSDLGLTDDPSKPWTMQELVQKHTLAGFGTKRGLDKFYMRVITPETYGAVGDGVTNDYDAFVQAVAATNAQDILFLGAKTYKLDTQLNLNCNTVGRGNTNSIIDGSIAVNSNVVLSDFRVGRAGLSSGFVNNADNVVIERVHFKHGSGYGNLYLNDSKATNIKFVDCIFSDNTSLGNGVKIVDKGTAAKHYENIRFVRCHFYNNDRMNYEVIGRNDVGFPVTSGYKNISLYKCIFDPSGVGAADTDINVSYDSTFFDGDVVNHSSGYSTVSECIIRGGSYGLELAGAVQMQVRANDIRDTTSFLLSTSQYTATEIVRNRIEGNTFISELAAGDVVVQGGKSLFEGNYVKTGGRLRYNTANAFDTLTIGNYVECTGVTAISIEGGNHLNFIGNHIYGGSNQSVLNIGAGSIMNLFIGNHIRSLNVVWDERDNTVINRMANYVDRGNGWDFADLFPNYRTLPTIRSQGQVAFVRYTAGTASSYNLVVTNAAGVSSWGTIPVLNQPYTWTAKQTFPDVDITGILAHKGASLGFYNVTPVTRPTALTAADASTVDTTYGTEESAVINNLRTRLNELETKLQSLGLLT